MKYLFSSLLILALLSSCRNDQALRTSDSTINVRLDRDPQRINPMFARNYVTAREVYPYVFLQLAEYDPASLSLSPILAKSIPPEIEISEGDYAGGVSYTFEILEEAVWTDGSPILAKDYIFTLKAVHHPEVSSPTWKNILGSISEVVIDEVNPKKFTVIFKEPNVQALLIASSFEFFPEHVYDKAGVLSAINLQEIQDTINHDRLKSTEGFSEFATNFNDVVFQQANCTGSGPYILSQWETDQYIRLERKENYWGNAYPERTFLNSNPKEIIFNIIPDEITAITQLKSGQIDLMTVSNGENFKQLVEEDSELNLHTSQLIRYYFIAMNNLSSKLQDKRVRRALSHLMDVDAFIEQFEHGNGSRTVGTILPFREEYNSQLELLDYDEEKAKELLKDAGWIDTDNNEILDKEILGQREELIFDMYISNGQLGKRLAILLSESCKKVGAKINIIQKDRRAIMRDNIQQGDYDLYPMVMSTNIGEWNPYNSWHSDNATNGGGNLVRYKNEMADALIEQLATESDVNERKKLYKSLQSQMYEDQPVIFLYSPVNKIATSVSLDPLISVKRPGYFLQTASIKEPSFSDN